MRWVGESVLRSEYIHVDCLSPVSWQCDPTHCKWHKEGRGIHKLEKTKSFPSKTPAH